MRVSCRRQDRNGVISIRSEVVRFNLERADADRSAIAAKPRRPETTHKHHPSLRPERPLTLGFTFFCENPSRGNPIPDLQPPFHLAVPPLLAADTPTPTNRERSSSGRRSDGWTSCRGPPLPWTARGVSTAPGGSRTTSAPRTWFLSSFAFASASASETTTRTMVGSASLPVPPPPDPPLHVFRWLGTV